MKAAPGNLSGDDIGTSTVFFIIFSTFREYLFSDCCVIYRSNPEILSFLCKFAALGVDKSHEYARLNTKCTLV